MSSEESPRKEPPEVDISEFAEVLETEVDRVRTKWDTGIRRPGKGLLCPHPRHHYAPRCDGQRPSQGWRTARPRGVRHPSTSLPGLGRWSHWPFAGSTHRRSGPN